MYLHVLAGLEALAADRAGVGEVARGVHVEDVLLEVAIVAVELAALGARGLAGLTVSEAGEARRVARARARPARSWGRRLAFSSRFAHFARPSSQYSPILRYDFRYDTFHIQHDFHCCYY